MYVQPFPHGMAVAPIETLLSRFPYNTLKLNYRTFTVNVSVPKLIDACRLILRSFVPGSSAYEDLHVTVMNTIR